MAYVTLAEFKAALANAGGAGARTAAELPDARLVAALEEAVGEATGRLTKSFTLPDPGADPLVAPDGIPGLLKTIIVGIAGYIATLEYYGSQPVEERDPVVLKYARALSLLDRIARGQLEVPGIDPTDGSSPSGEPAIYQGGPSVGLASGYLEDQASAYRATIPPHSGGLTWL